MYGVIRNSATVLVLGLIVASGCSSGKSPGQWFGLGASSAREKGVFYAAVDGLTVRDAAKSSAKIVGRLSLHQKVNRSKVRDGYAFVQVPGSDVAGWVVNSKLLWKLPNDAAAAAPVPADATSENSPAAVEGGPAPAEQTPAPAPEPSTPQSETPKPPASKPRSGASVFDPY